MLNKNDETTLTCLATGNNCEGIFKNDDSTIFVPFCLPKEIVNLKILKVSKKIAYGKILKVLLPSDNRVEPKCPVYSKCGGCHLQHVNYDYQLEIKKQIIIDAFSKIAFLNVSPNDCVSDSKCFRYRNKLQLPVADVDGNLFIGFYAENSHRVIPIDDCLINPKWTSQLIKALKEFMSFYRISGYDYKTNSGDVREITAREVGDSLIITLVTTKEKVPNLDKFPSFIQKYIKNEFSLYQNVNSTSTNVIYGDKFKLIFGKGSYKVHTLGITHTMGVRSFMQVNQSVCEKLYSRVIESIDFDKHKVVIDAYSGAGLMTALFAQKARKVYGIEIVPEAVMLANQLAKENNLSNKITNVLGKCEEVLPDIVEKESKTENVCVVLDPPRKGCDAKVIESLLKSNVKKIVYISCKPQTLARDVGLLCGTLKIIDGKIVKSEEIHSTYHIESVTPFDMFPNTKHVECCVLLSRGN